MEIKCSRCSSQRVTGGRVFSQPDYVSPGAYFRPKELRPFALTGINIRLENRFFGCLDCGLVWAQIDAKKLTGVIAKKGNKSIKGRLGLGEKKEETKEPEEGQNSQEV